MEEEQKVSLNDPKHRDTLANKLTDNIRTVYDRCHVTPREREEVKKKVQIFLEQKRKYNMNPKPDPIDNPDAIFDVALCTCFYRADPASYKLVNCKCRQKGKKPKWQRESLKFFLDQQQDRTLVFDQALYKKKIVEASREVPQTDNVEEMDDYDDNVNMYGGSDDEEDLHGGDEPRKEDPQTASTTN